MVNSPILKKVQNSCSSSIFPPSFVFVHAVGVRVEGVALFNIGALARSDIFGVFCALGGGTVGIRGRVEGFFNIKASVRSDVLGVFNALGRGTVGIQVRVKGNALFNIKTLVRGDVLGDLAEAGSRATPLRV